MLGEERGGFLKVGKEKGGGRGTGFQEKTI